MGESRLAPQALGIVAGGDQESPGSVLPTPYEVTSSGAVAETSDSSRAFSMSSMWKENSQRTQSFTSGTSAFEQLCVSSTWL